jgi:hypothetical protein
MSSIKRSAEQAVTDALASSRHDGDRKRGRHDPGSLDGQQGARQPGARRHRSTQHRRKRDREPAGRPMVAVGRQPATRGSGERLRVGCMYSICGADCRAALLRAG